MFAGAISLLAGSSIDIGNLAVPRPVDALADRMNQRALQAMQRQSETMTATERMEDPQAYARLQALRREDLESFLRIEANQAVLAKMIDLIGLICAENSWGASCVWFDDPSRPQIDLQAAETGMLLTWILRRYGARLSEISARIPVMIQGEVRRRLFAPILAHDDYPFMRGDSRFPALILSDLLLSCIMTETLPSRRQQPVRRLLHLLDKIAAEPPSEDKDLAARLADACALSDLARLLKRLTRGELDLTASVPPGDWLDDVLIPWMAEDHFLDPYGGNTQNALSGADLFRLGYTAHDKALRSLGAKLDRMHALPAFSLCGRILGMDLVRAMEDELSLPPKLKRAVTPDGGIMLSRSGELAAAIVRGGNRRNAGDIALFCGDRRILADLGGAEGTHSVPMIGGCDQLDIPSGPVQTEYSFKAERDIMSADLTCAYPQSCGLEAYQRTLMVMRGDGTVRLVDAFEFARPPQELRFRFVCAQKPLSLRDSVRFGTVRMTWDGELKPEILELEDARGYLLQFTLRDVPQRLICGFAFEADD